MSVTAEIKRSASSPRSYSGRDGPGYEEVVEMNKVSENMNMKWIYLAVQHHIGPAVDTSSLQFNIFKLNMLLANQSDLMAHLIPHTRGDGQGIVPTPVAGWQVCIKNLFAEIQHI